MTYTLANGKELTVGREEQTGLLRFILPEDGGKLPQLLSGKFTAQKYLDEAWGQYENQTENKRTRAPLAEDRPPMVEKEKKPESAFEPEVEKVLASEEQRNLDAIDEAPQPEAV